MTCSPCNRVGAKAPVVNFYIEQATDFRRSFQVKDSAGVVQSLDDWESIAGQAKRLQDNDAAIAFSFDLTIDKPEKRVFIEVPAASTVDLVVGESEKDEESIFYYDFIVTKTSGDRFRIQQGKAYVARAITKVTP